MKDSFVSYMDRVHAEQDLKEKTETYVRAALQNSEFRTERREAKRGGAKHLKLAVTAVAACAVLMVGGYAVYNTPIEYVSLDINPSVELGVNTFGRVVRAEACNEDGALLLEAGSVKRLSVEEAVRSLVQEAAELGFVAEDGSTVIAVTAETDDENAAAKMQAAGASGAQQALGAGGQSAVVYTDAIGLEIRTQAQEAGVSPGKFRLIQILGALDRPPPWRSTGTRRSRRSFPKRPAYGVHLNRIFGERRVASELEQIRAAPRWCRPRRKPGAGQTVSGNAGQTPAEAIRSRI
jgi:hypothetical protein